MIDWKAVHKKICEYLVANWTLTEIVWPGQDVPETGTWIEWHFLGGNTQIDRKSSKMRASLICQAGMFSTDSGLYVLSDVWTALQTLLQRVTIFDATHGIRFLEISTTPIFDGANKKVLQYRAATITAEIQEL